ncbi:MAG: PEP-CTERM/exosortase system-associated acyltransferase [Burkholderiales bacterium]|nr:PEP-CTERM/exosortase system-associated acyltransferase [Burkholderiales bacterium]
MNDLEAAFHQYFEILTADTPKLLEAVYDLRYRVLCIHNATPGFDMTKYPNKLENDGYDNRSTHLLLRHRPTGIFIGTTRLILPDPKNSEIKFPTELRTRFYPGFVLNESSRKYTAEISRFVMLNDFFKRKGEQNMLSQSIETEQKTQERRRFPHPMLALVVGIAQLCARHHVYHVISSMEPALNRLLGFYGLQLNPVGPSADYHGLRTPYYVYLLDMLDRMYQEHRTIWELVTDHGKIWPADLISMRRKSLIAYQPNKTCISG